VATILIVEDEADIAEGLAASLREGGHAVALAGDGAAALASVRAERPDVIILDIMLPVLDGLAVLARLRAEGNATPVLILSARDTEVEKVRGFRTGADDYLTKPFGLLELLARVDNLLRRARPSGPVPALRFGRTEVRPSGRQVLVDGVEVALRPREMDLLLALLRHPNAVVSRRSLLDQVWQYDPTIESRTVDWHVAELRRKIEEDPARPRYLLTVRKVGYRLQLG